MWSAVRDRLGFTSSNEAAGFDGKLWSLSGGGVIAMMKVFCNSVVK